MAQKKRLAEMLVEDGVITEDQLQNALRRQLQMGGKIGTNLIELRYINEEQLGTALSKIFGMPYLTADILQSIPSDVIGSIPQEMAIKQRIIPLKKEHRHITVAMENPNNIAIIDEIGFMTGGRVTTIVASEMRIALGLEKYYDHPRDMRYIEVLRPKEEEFVIERNIPLVDYTATPTFDVHVERHAVKPAVQPPAPVPAPVAAKMITFQETVNTLLNVDMRDHAIKAVLDYISQYVDNIIFFVMTPTEAKAWNAKCRGVQAGSLSDLKVAFGSPSQFLTVKNSEQPYYGDISGFPLDDVFLSVIGRRRPLRVFLLPILVKTKMVSILYIDNGNKEIPSEKVAEINSLVEKLSIAFEILLLKKKTEAK